MHKDARWFSHVVRTCYNYMHEKLSLNFIGCVTLGVVAFFVIIGNREVLSRAADSASQELYASVATATADALCYQQSDINAKKADEQNQNNEFTG